MKNHTPVNYVQKGKNKLKNKEFRSISIYFFSFRSGFQLTRHKLSHTGEKPHKCTYCDRSYAQTGDLRRHLRLHVGDSIYDCPQCTEKFRFHSELQIHIREHFKKDREAEKSLKIDPETVVTTTATSSTTNTTIVIEPTKIE